MILYALALIFADHHRLREHAHSASDMETRLIKGLVNEPDFTVVPQSIHQKITGIYELCSSYSFDKTISIGDSPVCSNPASCGYRIFVLAESTEIMNVPHDMKGDQRMRSVVYADAFSSLDGFVFIRGKASAVKDTLANMRFCQRRYDKQNSIYLKIEPVNLEDLSVDGQFKPEDPLTQDLREDGANGFPQDFTSGDKLVCSGNQTCAFKVTLQNNFKSQTVVGQFYTKSLSGKYIQLTKDIKESLRIDFFHGNTLYTSINSTKINDSGYFSVPVPASTNSPYELTMVVSDIQNKFITLRRGLLITGNDKSQVVAGNIPLILPTGKGCADSLDFAICSAQELNTDKGRIRVSVYSADSNRPLEGIKLKVTSQQTYKVPTEQTENILETDKSGSVVFGHLDFGYYTIRSLNDIYKKTVEFFNLDEREGQISIYLVPDMAAAMNINLKVDNLMTADTDLRVKIINHNQRECIVSSFSKYCAFALYLFDVGRGSSGMESIRIHNFTVSHYMVYSHTMFSLGEGRCDSLEVANSHFIQTKSMSWHDIQTDAGHAGIDTEGNNSSQPGITDKSKPFWIGYCFTGFGQQSMKTVNQLSATEPLASQCTDLYPDEDKHSLENLKSAIQSLN